MLLAQKSPRMKTPVKKLLKLNQDSNARALYEAREKRRRDILDGKQQARREERAEMARKLLEKKMAIADIADVTGFTIKEIESL